MQKKEEGRNISDELSFAEENEGERGDSVEVILSIKFVRGRK